VLTILYLETRLVGLTLEDLISDIKVTCGLADEIIYGKMIHFWAAKVLARALAVPT
jgi:hypothetical protein